MQLIVRTQEELADQLDSRVREEHARCAEAVHAAEYNDLDRAGCDAYVRDLSFGKAQDSTHSITRTSAMPERLETPISVKRITMI